VGSPVNLDIEASCWPEQDRPAMQHVTIKGKRGDGRVLCTLEGLRWAEACFDITRAEDLVEAFDEHSASAYGLAMEIHKRRRAMAARYEVAGSFASGFIGFSTFGRHLRLPVNGSTLN
jgi:hypothetical protein